MTAFDERFTPRSRNSLMGLLDVVS